MRDLPTPETNANAFIETNAANALVFASFARKLERERDEAREALKHIGEYGTEEINASVDLRQKLATALVERDGSREVALAQQSVITDLMVENKKLKNLT